MGHQFSRKRSRVKRAALVLFLVGAAVLGWMYHVATADPLVSWAVDLRPPSAARH